MQDDKLQFHPLLTFSIDIMTIPSLVENENASLLKRSVILLITSILQLSRMPYDTKYTRMLYTITITITSPVDLP
jgi:hypothetical protein